jgi:hypothetical protein
MTAVCLNGHSSATDDYCDTCGAPIAAPEPPPSAVAPVKEAAFEAEGPDTSSTAVQAPCPRCSAPRSGDDRYCESCGHDFLAPPSSGPVWEAVATADRAQFGRLAVEGISFPDDAPELHFVLDSDEVLIGRSRPDGGDDAPAINLVEDPGVSHLHAVLERQPDGTYAVRDLGSTNGTTINDDPAPQAGGAAVPLADGDRIRLGAWTTITLHSR